MGVPEGYAPFILLHPILVHPSPSSPKEHRMAIPHLLVHEKKDSVGVVVVEGLKAGTEMLAVITHDNTDFRIQAKMDIPIGHKIALKSIKKGDTILKYGQDIGIAKADIAAGEHVHVHNVKTKRW
jgi:(2R)-sulfolactate sulfo-lyase subunit alpha